MKYDKKVEMIPQFRPYIGRSEINFVNRTLEKNWISEGEATKTFVEKLLDLIGAKYGVMAPNGTLSIYMALRAIGIGPGDEVIVPDLTFIATANAVELTGAKPIFCDVGYDLSLDLEKAKSLVSRRTKAIMPVHLYGTASNMDEITQFAAKVGIMIVEDAAQGIGVTWGGTHVGSIGLVNSFSFFADKTITTGEGGFVATNSEEIYNYLQYFRNQGRLNRGSFVHPKMGYNFRITDIQSALGLAQLTKLDRILADKKRILNAYKENLDKQITVLEPKANSKSNHIPFRVCILTKQNSTNLHDYLRINGIEPRTFFYPLHLQPCYKKRPKSWSLKGNALNNSNFSVSNDLFQRGTCLPSWVGLSNGNIKYICKKINEFIR